MILVSRQNSTSIQRLVESRINSQPTYAAVGASLSGNYPSGFHHDHYERVLGQGREVFEYAREGLQTWQAHNVPGVAVHPQGAEIQPGGTVVITLGFFVALAAPCRIIEVLAEPRKWGFAYGTLPGHPEEGEEAFVLTWAEDDIVHFEIKAFSRPADRLVRFAGSIGRRIQRSGTTGYLTSLQKFVTERFPG
ncbi:MAG TPA: DUF1990 domain-containing protein [Acidimicrobiales bacterium]|nr:DUF1990 domain-containing protein [Acidimicrobiales bacterium]